MVKASSVTTNYLSIYNAVSLVLWSIVLYQALGDIQVYLDPEMDLVSQAGCIYNSHFYVDYPHKTLVLIQVFNAIVETSNSLLGIVNSPILTLILQFAARLFITVGISYMLPQSPGNFNFGSYSSLSLAWSITEIIRYGFYLVKLTQKKVPYALLWLRYSAFFVLYPVGLFSELYVAYLSLDSVKGYGYYWFLVFGLAMYIPGFVILYGFMIRQRRNYLKPLPIKKNQ